MSFFTNYPEFVERDVRKTRGTTTVTIESLDNRSSALLPKWLVEGKSVLDLGNCAGAFGHWALSNGAAHYTGVDIQQEFCATSKELLSKHHSVDKFTIIEDDVLQFLLNAKNQEKQYDIILAAGVIHGYLNVIELIKLMCDVSKEYIVVESLEADETLTPSIQFKLYNMVTSKVGNPYTGWTPIVGFNALRAIMNEYGFALHGDRIYPKPITGSHDAYHDKIETELDAVHGIPSRYMVRYMKANTNKNSLEYKIRTNKQEYRKPFINSKVNIDIIKPKRWEFDEGVAKRFQEEAKNNIPDYERVIDMCLDIANRKYDKGSTIVDVGSALGHTIEKFNEAGYSDVYGVESSQAMYDNSNFKSFVHLSDTFPKDWRANFVMANWTLHFVTERKQYIQDVYNALRDGGTFILSDKTPQSDDIKELYYDFKRSNGVTDEYIYEKEEKLKGYMNLLPIEWYMDTLKEVGFKSVQIINAKYGFVTFYAEK